MWSLSKALAKKQRLKQKKIKELDEENSSIDSD